MSRCGHTTISLSHTKKLRERREREREKGGIIFNLFVRRGREGYDGVVCVRRVGTLGEDNRARNRAHDDGYDPPEHGLAENDTVNTTCALQKGNTRGGTDLIFCGEIK